MALRSCGGAAPAAARCPVGDDEDLWPVEPPRLWLTPWPTRGFRVNQFAEIVALMVAIAQDPWLPDSRTAEQGEPWRTVPIPGRRRHRRVRDQRSRPLRGARMAGDLRHAGRDGVPARHRAGARGRVPRGRGLRGRPGSWRLTLAHNVGSPDEVDAVLAKAQDAGRTGVRDAIATDRGGYSGVFADPDCDRWRSPTTRSGRWMKTGVWSLPE